MNDADLGEMLLDRGLYLIRFGEIGDEGAVRHASWIRQLAAHSIQGVFIAGEKRDLGAELRETQGAGPADALGAAADQRLAAFETVI